MLCAKDLHFLLFDDLENARVGRAVCESGIHGHSIAACRGTRIDLHRVMRNSGPRRGVKENDLFLNFTNNSKDNPQTISISSTVNVESLGTLALCALNWGTVPFRPSFRASGAFL